MIIHLKSTVGSQLAREIGTKHQGIIFQDTDGMVLVTTSKMKEIPDELEKYVSTSFPMESDIQLASKDYLDGKRKIDMGDTVIGGDTNRSILIAGPCSVESEDQIIQCAELLMKHDIKVLRAGCFKPRTSPYTFQGLGEKGLDLLKNVREKYGLKIITEVKDSSHVDLVIRDADIIQIGAKAMYDHSILRKCGETTKPVLLKRGFGTTLQEFVQAAEFILSGGNPNVILCERGIRTFETKTRFTLDLCGVAFLKEYTNLPIIVDPSHAMGYRYGVSDLARAAMAMGVEGLLIETHPTPEQAKSDASQQLNFEEFTSLAETLPAVAKAIGRTLV